MKGLILLTSLLAYSLVHAEYLPGTIADKRGNFEIKTDCVSRDIPCRDVQFILVDVKNKIEIKRSSTVAIEEIYKVAAEPFNYKASLGFTECDAAYTTCMLYEGQEDFYTLYNDESVAAHITKDTILAPVLAVSLVASLAMDTIILTYNAGIKTPFLALKHTQYQNKVNEIKENMAIDGIIVLNVRHFNKMRKFLGLE